ncbi:hypothetical protein INN71_05645 [Nocardioides sp. ChNu-153]|uniref:hypothetical protein n=1 Tax=unclassified Nocardioides TaxID=2615069 RepID=UPI0024076082|nr:MULTISPECIES: hypothetical protein [unclassified Nocardioides]MDF9717425.1 hypothetical protein [Nocardioides sp. ChNu-99]MDN7120869.1 hypothetical protein [Nocardioides sp. ChNu-153]
MGEPTDAVVTEADALYALAPGDFTAARDARAKELKGEDVELSRAVKALRRPSVAAWLVNQLVRHEPARVEDLLSVGAALREAQDSLSADDLRAFTRQRRQLTATTTTRARALGRELGTRVSESVAEQVEATLTAAMLDAGAGEAVRTGLLTAALETAGLDPVDVDAALAVPGATGHVATPVQADDADGDDADDADGAGGGRGPGLHVVPDPDEAARVREEAEQALAAAEERLAASEAELADLDAEVDELEARGMQAQARVDELRALLVEAQDAQARTEDELADAEDARAEHQETVEAARTERDEAAAALARLDEA